VREIHGLLNRGYREVVDCDLSGYFDSIPHHELMKSIARRISDGALLGLIKAWLEMSVEEDDGHGGKRRSSVAKDSGRGTPQGAPITPQTHLVTSSFQSDWPWCDGIGIARS
jgi:RNA-directed DNA polymerase